MEKEGLVIITTKNEFKSWLKEEIQSDTTKTPVRDFEADKLSKEQAAKLIGKSIPTLNKLIRDGKLKEYGFGKRGKYLLRSEAIEAFKNSNI